MKKHVKLYEEFVNEGSHIEFIKASELLKNAKVNDILKIDSNFGILTLVVQKVDKRNKKLLVNSVIQQAEKKDYYIDLTKIGLNGPEGLEIIKYNQKDVSVENDF